MLLMDRKQGIYLINIEPGTLQIARSRKIWSLIPQKLQPSVKKDKETTTTQSSNSFNKGQQWVPQAPLKGHPCKKWKVSSEELAPVLCPEVEEGNSSKRMSA